MMTTISSRIDKNMFEYKGGNKNSIDDYRNINKYLFPNKAKKVQMKNL